MACKRIYLSPSNQSGNLYAVDNVSEKVVIEEIAAYLKQILEDEYNWENIIIAPSNLGIRERSRDALNKDTEVYLALHSNAGGGATASGAIAFYHPNFLESRQLAANIVSNLNKISPYPSNRNDPVRDGMEVFNGRGFLEIRLPGELMMIPVLVEIDFHDNPLTARYIIENKKEIAASIAQAINITINLRVERKYIMSFVRKSK